MNDEQYKKISLKIVFWTSVVELVIGIFLIPAMFIKWFHETGVYPVYNESGDFADTVKVYYYYSLYERLTDNLPALIYVFFVLVAVFVILSVLSMIKKENIALKIASNVMFMGVVVMFLVMLFMLQYFVKAY